MIRITEQPSKYRHLEKMSVDELIANINKEDQTVAFAIEKELPTISRNQWIIYKPINRSKKEQKCLPAFVQFFFVKRQQLSEVMNQLVHWGFRIAAGSVHMSATAIMFFCKIVDRKITF